MTPKQSRDPPKGTAVILHHEATVRSLMTALIVSAGLNVLEARDLDHAISLLQPMASRGGVLIANARTPGSASLHNFAQVPPGTRIIFISEHAEVDTINLESTSASWVVSKALLSQALVPALEKVGMFTAPPPATARQRVILLVEDYAPIRNVLQSILIEEEFSVLTATNAGEALELSRLYRGTIHLLLSDVELPRMTGLELAHCLENEGVCTKILLMSGYSPEELGECNRSYNFIWKPFVPRALLAQIREIVERTEVAEAAT